MMSLFLNKNTCRLLVAGLVVLNIAVIALSLWRPRPPLPPPGAGGDVATLWKNELGLNDEQVARFRDIYRAHRETAEPLFRTVQENKKRMIDAATDSAAVHDIIEQTVAAHRELEEALVQHYLELRTICTPEQQKRLEEIFLSTMGPRPGPGSGPPRR